MTRVMLLKKVLLVSMVACLSVNSFSAVLPDYEGSGITLVEATWTTSATPIADGSNTFLAGGVEGQYALPENSGSWTENTLWNHRSNASVWDFPGLTKGVGGYAHVGHGYASAATDLVKITVEHAVTNGVYDVYAIYFAGPTTGGVATGLTGGNLLEYNYDTVGTINLSQPGEYALYAVKVGTQTGTLVSIDFDQYESDVRVTAVGLGYKETDMPYCQNPPEMDFTGPDGVKDCIVNIYDFADFAASWMTACLPAQQPIVFNDNGAWCWFEDERVIIHDGKLIIGSVADNAGTDGSSRAGNIEVVSYDIDAGGPPIRTVLNSSFAGDDHNSPAFLVLPDNKILTMYTGHSSDSYVRYRTSTNPNDATSWQPEQTNLRGGATSYSNIFRLSAENGGNGRIYDFYRGENWCPNFIYSDDNGQSWSYGGQLVTFSGRPYVKYTSNNIDKIHFITTEHHPSSYLRCSIYHGYIQDGNVYKSDGTFIKDLADGPVAPTDLTKVFAGDLDNNAWTTDIHLDENGYPYIGYSVRIDANPNDHRYGYARWDGLNWYDHEMAYGGTNINGKDHYTGLLALDPHDPDRVFISTNSNPYIDEPLISAADGKRHYEIFEGTTTDFGATWTWFPITKDSVVDNLRPIVPLWDGQQTALLWMQGRYGYYTDYDLDIVGLFDPQPVVGDCTHDFDGDYIVDVADLIIFVQSWLECGLLPDCN